MMMNRPMSPVTGLVLCHPGNRTGNSALAEAPDKQPICSPKEDEKDDARDRRYQEHRWLASSAPSRKRQAQGQSQTAVPRMLLCPANYYDSREKLGPVNQTFALRIAQ